LFDLFLCDTPSANLEHDRYTKIAIREAMMDDFGYCYFGKYDKCERDSSKNFLVQVMYHLLLYDLATCLEMPGLLHLSAAKFVAAFNTYCVDCSVEQRVTLLNQCLSPGIIVEYGFEQGTKLVQDTALEVFRGTIDGYKKYGKFKEMLDIMEAVPFAAAKLYSQPWTQEKNEPDAEAAEEDETEDEESTEDEGDEKIVKEEYVTG
jgi:hypothetical protein